MAYGMPMQVAFPYFYPSNSTKLHHFATSTPSNQVPTVDKPNTKQNQQSPESSSSPINFSARMQSNLFAGINNIGNDVSVTVLPQCSTPNSNDEKQSEHVDDENVEVD